MTHKLASFALCAALLTACTTPAEPQRQTIGMGNPASMFCIEQNGTLEIRKDARGNEYGMCHLPNGEVVEEWEYFRKNNGK